jgi:hypothetical protein
MSPILNAAKSHFPACFCALWNEGSLTLTFPACAAMGGAPLMFNSQDLLLKNCISCTALCRSVNATLLTVQTIVCTWDSGFAPAGIYFSVRSAL